jgi:hypothetical protein
MAYLKWETPALVNLNDIQNADGDCSGGSSPGTGGDGICQTGALVMWACTTGNNPDDGTPVP